MSQVQPLMQELAALDPVEAGAPRPSLAIEVNKSSGAGLNRCYQCGACANGCPFVQAMDYTPNQVIRLLQFGRSQEALTCKTI